MNYFNFILSSIVISMPSFIAIKQSLNPDAEVLKKIFNDTSFDDTREVLLSLLESSADDSSKNLSKDDIKCVKNFFLWTRDYRDGKEEERLDPKNISSIKYSHFQSRKSYFIIHGFLGNGKELWIQSLKDKLLNLEDCNVISVDWPAGNAWFIISYITTVKKVGIVGNDTAFLMRTLIQYKGMLLEDVHFIGHSLGAHAAGFASKTFKGSVGRISGLDPAGPYYHNLDANHRLDKSDAIYVDIIHTNGCTKWPFWTGCYGLNENIGHSDFWPNGGQHQPGCESKLLKGDIGCDHQLSHKYYTESLDYNTNTTLFLARPCTSWSQYVIDNCTCGKEPQFMGFNVNTMVSGVFYLWTNSEPPYAVSDWECSGSPLPWKMIILITCGILAIIVMVSCLLCGCYFLRFFQFLCCKKCTRTTAHSDLEESLIHQQEDEGPRRSSSH